MDFRFERKRVRRRSPVDTKRGAEEYERLLRTRLLNGESLDPHDKKEVPTFAEFAEEFMATYAMTNNKPSELASKRHILDKYLLPAFGKLRLDEIGVREVETLKARIVKLGRAPATVRNVLARLSKVLRFAQQAKLVSEVPNLGLPRIPKQLADFLSIAETIRLLLAADPEWRTMILAAVRTGLRISELLTIRWEDIDLVVGRLMVRRSVWNGIVGTPKSGRDRELPLSTELVTALTAHRRRRLHPGPLVFCAESGRMLNRHEVRAPLERACRKAGLRNVGWHVLRHTFASQLVMKGVPIKAVQELLGHSTIGMTERYAHLSPDVRRDAVQLLDAAPSGHQMGTGVVLATLAGQDIAAK